MKAVGRFKIQPTETVLVIVDIQERLASVMEEREKVVRSVGHLVEMAKLYQIPVILTEQYPKGLGPTVGELRESLRDVRPVEKITFSCWDEDTFRRALNELQKRKVILTGMETHVCVLQTCLDLLEEGYNVHVVRDAVTSRKLEDKEVGLNIMQTAGAVVTCTETVLFQVLKRAGTEEFRPLSRRIK